MNIEDQVEKTKDDAKEAGEPEVVSGDGEFKFTVRKLEMPIRPRGVLAE